MVEETVAGETVAGDTEMAELGNLIANSDPDQPPANLESPVDVMLIVEASAIKQSSSSASQDASFENYPFPKINSFTKVSASSVIRWLRRGRDKAETERRFAETARRLPQLESYISGELTSTMQYWADWARVRGLTFDLEALTMYIGVSSPN